MKTLITIGIVIIASMVISIIITSTKVISKLNKINKKIKNNENK
mgnify:CR=1 FL=1